MNKKIISLLLCVLLLVSFAGCSQSKPIETKPTEDTKVETVPNDELTPPINVEPATFAASDTWYKGKTDSKTIKEIEILSFYNPTGSEIEFWSIYENVDTDVSSNNDIMCYIIGEKLIIAGNGAAKILVNQDASYMFSNKKSQNFFENVEKITGLNLLDTSNCETFEYMFAGCKSLTNLDLSNFDTSNVKSMSYMFEDCESLNALNITSFNTAAVTNMSYMFSGCRALTDLNLSNFNTENVTNLGSLFYNCKSLVNLDISNFNTDKINSLDHMFEGCESLKAVNISHFNTSNVTSMLGLFNSCSSLEEVNMEGLNLSNLRDFSYVFAGCKSLKTLKLDNLITVKGLDYCFYGCESLTFDCSGWNVDNVESCFGFNDNAEGVKAPNWKN